MIFQFTSLYLSIVLLFAPSAFADDNSGIDTIPDLYIEKVVVNFDHIKKHRFVSNYALYEEGWSELQQAIFWRKVIQLHHDSAILNIANTPNPIHIVNT